MDDAPEFVFVDAPVRRADAVHVVRVPAGIASKSELLRILYVEGRFPEYFGFNWDALLDCLSDFGWIDAPEIAIVHAELPSLPPEQLAAYLLVLRDALARGPSRGRSTRVEFPSAAEHRVRSLLGA